MVLAQGLLTVGVMLMLLADQLSSRYMFIVGVLFAYFGAYLSYNMRSALNGDIVPEGQLGSISGIGAAVNLLGGRLGCIVFIFVFFENSKS